MNKTFIISFNLPWNRPKPINPNEAIPTLNQFLNKHTTNISNTTLKQINQNLYEFTFIYKPINNITLQEIQEIMELIIPEFSFLVNNIKTNQI